MIRSEIEQVEKHGSTVTTVRDVKAAKRHKAIINEIDPFRELQGALLMSYPTITRDQVQQIRELWSQNRSIVGNRNPRNKAVVSELRAKGLLQSQIAERLGLSAVTISRACNGHIAGARDNGLHPNSRLSPEAIKEIWNNPLGISINELAERHGVYPAAVKKIQEGLTHRKFIKEHLEDCEEAC